MLINQRTRNCIVSKFQAGLPPDVSLSHKDTTALFEVYSAVRDPLVPVLELDAFDWVIAEHSYTNGDASYMVGIQLLHTQTTLLGRHWGLGTDTATTVQQAHAPIADVIYHIGRKS